MLLEAKTALVVSVDQSFL